MFCILLAAILALPVVGHDGEVVIMEEPYTVVECAAVLGKITIGDNDPSPLYATILHAVLGEDMGEWESGWQTFFLLFTAAAVDCENEQSSIDKQEPADDSGEPAASESEDAGLEYSSAVDGQEPLLGPITLPDGIYVVSLESNGYASAEFEAVAECEGEMAYGMLIYQDEGKVQERLDIETDCRLTIQIDASADWKLSIEKLTDVSGQAGASETGDTAHKFSSVVDGQEPVLGPIMLPGAIYIVSLESDSFTSAKFEAVANCDGDMAYGMLIYQDEGKVQERLDVESDCRLTIQVDASGDWALSIKPL